MDWEAIERLQEEIRDYRAAGAIGSFEVLIRTNEMRLDAIVTAEIVNAVMLAELRGLERPKPGPEADHPPRMRLEPETAL